MSELKDCYKVLGLTEDATSEEVERAYLSLKEKYSKERFLEGEEGNLAAKNLTKVENAYKEILSKISEENYFEEQSSSISEVESLIIKGDYNGAQNKLDQITSRDAEWHYMQSVIFYKKNWVNESKKQLEIAVSLDPHNSKYSTAYAKLKEKTEFNENAFRSNPNQNNYQQNNRQMGGAGTNDCCTFCATWCCMDMLCSICCH